MTDVGAYTGSASPYGTFDQDGNAWEWNEQILFSGSYRGLRGGNFFYGASLTASSSPSYTGFRVATFLPEPGTSLLVMTGLLGLAARRKRRT